MIYNLTKYLDDQIKKNEMDGACSTYGGEERCIQGFGGKTWRKETTWETQALMGESIKMDIKEMGWRIMGWIDLDWDTWWAVLNVIVTFQVS